MVRYGITPSMNLLMRNGNGEFLFLERLNEPALGQWWAPGGRLRNGETARDGVLRLATEELGLGDDSFEILHVSDRHSEEIFPVAEMSPVHVQARYGEGTAYVHYWASFAYIEMKPGYDAVISLDSQSSSYEWFGTLPPGIHPYVAWYFKALAEAGFPSL